MPKGRGRRARQWFVEVSWLFFPRRLNVGITRSTAIDMPPRSINYFEPIRRKLKYARNNLGHKKTSTDTIFLDGRLAFLPRQAPIDHLLEFAPTLKGPATRMHPAPSRVAGLLWQLQAFTTRSIPLGLHTSFRLERRWIAARSGPSKAARCSYAFDAVSLPNRAL